MNPELQRQKALAENAAQGIPPSKKRRKRTEFERRLVWCKTGGHCFYCGDELDFIWDFVCDHYIPLSRGGHDDHSNLVPACYFCDNRKRSFMPTRDLCIALKKWKRGELVPKQYLDLPPAISKEKLSVHQQRQVKRYKESREHQIAWEEYKRNGNKAKAVGFFANPVLPWQILGNHKDKLYGDTGNRSVEERVGRDPQGILGGDTARGLYEGGPINSNGSAAQQGTAGEGGTP